ncbi:MAG: KH domain-containing protein [Proteobacteria bacterium]|nr:KH domain-containing protein [Pseudomonadota bacterium]
MASESESAADLVGFIAKAIVNNPDDVQVTAIDDGQTLELETAAEDRGRVIGRQGRVAKAMRALLAASRPGANWRLDIVD